MQLREKRESRQSPGILIIPELRHDLTEEAMCVMSAFLLGLMRHESMKYYFDLRGLWHIWVAAVCLDTLILNMAQ